MSEPKISPRLEKKWNAYNELYEAIYSQVFKKHFDEVYDVHAVFAYHAAFPVIFSVDLLYQIWFNFRLYPGKEHGQLLAIPNFVVSDFIQSNLCEYLGEGLYSVDYNFREFLVNELRKDSRFGQDRLYNLATFLEKYRTHKSKVENQSLSQYHHLLARVTLNPQAAAEKLGRELAEAIKGTDKPGIRRLSRILIDFQKSDRSFEDISIFAKQVDASMNKGISIDTSAIPVLTDEQIGPTSLQMPITTSVRKQLQVKEKEYTRRLFRKGSNKVYALLVGINEYASESVSNLSGTLNDINAFTSFLSENVEADTLVLKTLTNGEANRAAIIEHIWNHLGQGEPGDSLLFYFSGQGAKERTELNFEDKDTDGLIQTLICHDSRQNDVPDLALIEIQSLLHLIGKKKPNITVIFDACHSGKMERFTTQAPSGESNKNVSGHRMAFVRMASRPAESFIFFDSKYEDIFDDIKLPEAPDDTISIPDTNYVLLASSLNRELSVEQPIQGEVRGLFSYALIDALNDVRYTPSYRELVQRAILKVKTIFANQTPNVDTHGGASIHDLFLYGALERRMEDQLAYYNEESQKWELSIGRQQGVDLNITTFLSLSSIDAQKKSEKRIGRIDKIFENTSFITFTGEAPPSNREDVFKADLYYYALPKTKLFLPNLMDNESPLGATDLFEIVKNREHARYIVDLTQQVIQTNAPFTIKDQNGNIVLNSTLLDEGASGKLKHLHVWDKLYHITNPLSKLAEADCLLDIKIKGEGKSSEVTQTEEIQYDSKEVFFLDEIDQCLLKNENKSNHYYCALFSFAKGEVSPNLIDRSFYQLGPEQQFDISNFIFQQLNWIKEENEDFVFNYQLKLFFVSEAFIYENFPQANSEDIKPRNTFELQLHHIFTGDTHEELKNLKEVAWQAKAYEYKFKARKEEIQKHEQYLSANLPSLAFVFNFYNDSEFLNGVKLERERIFSLFKGKNKDIGYFIWSNLESEEDLTEKIYNIEQDYNLFSLHIAGSGNANRLSLGDDKKVELNLIIPLLKRLSSLRLIFLNYDNSKVLASSFNEAGIDCVIASQGGVEDRMAAAFAFYFYDFLLKGLSVAESFQMAYKGIGIDEQVELRHGPGLLITNIPIPWQLFTREDTDPHEVFLFKKEKDQLEIQLRESSKKDFAQYEAGLLNPISESLIPVCEVYQEGTGNDITYNQLQSYLWDSKAQNGLVIGAAGIGKTMTLIQLWKSLLAVDNECIPVYIPFLKLDFNHNDPYDPILGYVFHNYLDENKSFGELVAWLEEPFLNLKPKLLLLLDGLNEIKKEFQKDILSELDVLAKYGGVQVIATTRNQFSPARNLPGFQDVKIKSLSEAIALEYLEHKAQPFVQQVLKSLEITPLLLYVLNESTDLSTEGEVLSTYEQLLAVQDSRNKGAERIWIYNELLPYLAYDLYFSRSRVLNTDRLISLIQRLLSNQGGSITSTEVLAELEVISPVFDRDMPGAFQFSRAIWLEYYVAKFMLQYIRDLLQGSSFPEILNTSHIGSDVLKYMGELDGVHKINLQQYFSSNAEEERNSLILSTFELCRKQDRDLNVALDNIFECLKITRNNVLDGMDCSGVKYSGSTLEGVSLRASIFEEVKIVGGIFKKGIFSESVFKKSTFEDCDFSDSLMPQILSESVNWKNCNFSNVDFRGSFFKNSDLSEKAVFSRANLSKSGLANVNLSGANMYLVALRDADLFNANLKNCNLAGADLNGANLAQADLSFCNFNKAIGLDFDQLNQGADLEGVWGIEKGLMNKLLEQYSQRFTEEIISVEDKRPFANLNLLGSSSPMRKLEQIINDQTGYKFNFPGNFPLKAGDFGFFDNRRFATVGNLLDLGLSFDVQTTRSSSFNFEIGQAQVEVIDLRLLDDPSSYNENEIAVKFTFPRSEYVYLNIESPQVLGLKHREGKLKDEIQSYYQSGRWNINWAIASETVSSPNFTIIGAFSEDAEMIMAYPKTLLDTNASPSIDWIVLPEAREVSSKNINLHIRSASGVPLYKISALRKPWFSANIKWTTR